MVNPRIFREYDVRGLVKEDLTPDAVRALADGFAVQLRERGGRRVVVGRDARESSIVYAGLLGEVFGRAGLDVIDVGLVPTPVVYWAAHALPSIDGFVMITGSHNPPEYNGFKLGFGAAALHGAQIQALRRVVEEGRKVTGRGSIVHVDVLPGYLAAIRSSLSLGPHRPKIVIDAGNGVGALTALPLYEALGFPVDGLFLEPDGTFPNHHPDPTVEENLVALQRRVRETKAQVGLAFDGDADRLGVVDETGRVLWGDELMILFARDVLAREPGATIVGEVKCSQTMYDAIAQAGGKSVMWKAGHSLIKAKMKETHAALAGEMSGHLFFQSRWYGFDDGVYAGARLLELLSRDPRPLHERLADVPKLCSTPELRRDTGTDERKFALVAAAIEHFRREGMQVIDVDGARVLFPDGWGLVRASNTQPILVLRYEAKTEEGLARIQATFEKTLTLLEGRLP